MTMKTARGAAAGLACLLALASIASPSLAQTPAASLKAQLVGHWALVSVSIGESQPYGAHPQGSMFLDAGGHYSVVVVSEGAANSISYFGDYTVDDASGAVTMHIAASSRPSAAGRDEKRLVTFSGDELIVGNRKKVGSLGAVALTWRRAD
jgi:hypothetical protein